MLNAARCSFDPHRGDSACRPRRSLLQVADKRSISTTEVHFITRFSRRTTISTYTMTGLTWWGGLEGLRPSKNLVSAWVGEAAHPGGRSDQRGRPAAPTA